MHLAQTELAVVRIQDAVAADFVLQRKSFGFELDAVLAGDVWTHIEPGRLLFIRMAELEDYLGIAHGKAVHVGNTPPQDERIVVETEIRSVAEGDLPNLRPESGLNVGN